MHRVSFAILDTASALEAFARAHAASRMPTDARSPEDLFQSLRHQVHKMDRKEEDAPNPDQPQRLRNLAVASTVRAMAHVDAELGQKMYAFLRSSHHMPRIRHSRMFRLLPNGAEKLRFINFLYANGKQNPVYYVERFADQFPGQKLRFVSKTSGFTLERAESE